jgi:hypothetical protein
LKIANCKLKIEERIRQQPSPLRVAPILSGNSQFAIFNLQFSICLLLLLTTPAIPQQIQLTPQELDARFKAAGDDPLKLLPLLPVADGPKAKTLRARIHKLLVEQSKPLTPAERLDLARKVAEVLPAAMSSPAEVVDVLGKAAAVNRQVLHRRHVEQWVYDSPLPLVVVFSHSRGLSPQLLSVRAEKVTQP